MWFSNLFGWQKTKAAIDELEKELTPAMKASLPLVAKPAAPAWVAVWSWSLQEWITISGALPEGFGPPVALPSTGIAEFYAAPSQQ